MKQMSDRNRIFFGYRGGYINEKLQGDALEWTFGRCERQPMTFKDECVRAAELNHAFATSLGLIPTIMLSGGMDSEVTALCFKELGLPFKAVTYDYTVRPLHHETVFVDAFVKRHAIDHQYVKRDWWAWLQTDQAAELFLTSGASVPSLLPLLQTMREVYADGGFPILGCGDASIRRIDGVWHFCTDEGLRTMECRQLMKDGADGSPMFFQYTPEQVLSYLLEPRVQRAIDPGNRHAVVLKDLSLVKYAVYRDYWPVLTPRRKFTQYERNYEEYKTIQDRMMAARSVHFTDLWKVPVADFIQQLRPVLS